MEPSDNSPRMRARACVGRIQLFGFSEQLTRIRARGENLPLLASTGFDELLPCVRARVRSAGLCACLTSDSPPRTCARVRWSDSCLGIDVVIFLASGLDAWY